jgi:hypothetical protein
VRTPRVTTGEFRSGDRSAVVQYAMFVWPRLDRRVLARFGGDVRRIAAYVARRTSLPVEEIVEMLEAHQSADRDLSFYFG